MYNIFDPILVNLPIPIKTDRIIIRPLLPGEGKKLNEAALEDYSELIKWINWNSTEPSIDESELYIRKTYAKFILREKIALAIWYQEKFVGMCNLYNFDWKLLSCHIGYWCRKSMQNNGFITEAVNITCLHAFKYLKIRKINLLCDEANLKSIAIAEKCNFSLEFRANGIFYSNAGQNGFSMNRQYVRFL